MGEPREARAPFGTVRARQREVRAHELLTPTLGAGYPLSAEQIWPHGEPVTGAGPMDMAGRRAATRGGWPAMSFEPGAGIA
jgi:hypothetical protein